MIFEKRVGRIELPATDWKSVVLPLYDTRLSFVGKISVDLMVQPLSDFFFELLMMFFI